jgi:hypothetical protein
MTDLDDALIKHKYRLLSGELAINVTAISGLLDDGKAAAFAGAALKLERQGLNYREEWKAKAERGSRVHAHCEAFLKGESTEVRDDEHGFVDAVEAFLSDNTPEVVELEEITLSHHGYGGRFDMIVKIDGVCWLLDLKTGSEYPIEHTLQLSAYRYADGMAVYDDEGTLTDVRPMPYIDKTGCLYVRDDGTYKIVEYPASKVAHDHFVSLLNVYKWTRNEEMKQLKKESRAK